MYLTSTVTKYVLQTLPTKLIRYICAAFSFQLERVSKAARIPIAVNQIECNAFYQQKKLRETMDKLGIKVMAYAPIGSPGTMEHPLFCCSSFNVIFCKIGRSEPKPGKPALPKILEDSTVTGLAKKYKKTPAQVLLRHLVQLGFIVIPKSVKQHRIKCVHNNEQCLNKQCFPICVSCVFRILYQGKL